jgi:hypothetical protein
MIIDKLADGDRTESGLIVPKGSIEKKRKVISNAQWKMWRRAVRDMMNLGITVAMIHKECDEMLAPLDDEASFECKCTKWEIHRRI